MQLRMKTSFDLDVLIAKKRLDQAESGKAILMRMVSMRVGLIRGTSSNRVHGDSADSSSSRTESTD
jgi:hypothetical protein